MKRAADTAALCGRTEMASSLLRLTNHAPSNLFEALQTSIIYYHLQQFFDGTYLRTLGRLDNLYYPYYARENKNEADKLLLDYIKEIPKGKFDMIIVDPPAFAKHRGALDNALRAYRRLNANAIEKVAPGGFVFTYSCSQVVDKESFALAVFSAAAQCGRRVRILDRLNQPCDHSVNIYHPEGEYLKGLLLYVE